MAKTLPLLQIGALSSLLLAACGSADDFDVTSLPVASEDDKSDAAAKSGTKICPITRSARLSAMAASSPGPGGVSNERPGAGLHVWSPGNPRTGRVDGPRRSGSFSFRHALA